LEVAARAVLARPPRPPRDIDLFSSNTLFGQPGIYPEGSPMVPAAPGATSDEVGDEDRIAAALAALAATVAGGVVARAFPTGTTGRSLRFGEPASPGRVVGPAGGDPDDRVINERYRDEDPMLLAPSLAHDLLWSPTTTGHAAETVLHAI
jgi:hypothetical protein